MANYYANCRTNYFKVKDVDAFMADIGCIPGLDICDEGDKGICILGDDADGAGWPSFIWNEEEDDHMEIDFPLEVSKHLADGEVAIFMESGAEKLRYIVGYAVAINNQGEQVSIGLNDIYGLATELTDRPEDITTAEY